MEKMSTYLFSAGTLALAGALVGYLAATVSLVMSSQTVVVGRGGLLSLSRVTRIKGWPMSGRVGSMLAWNAEVFLVLALITRAVAAGRGPFSNMYEFSMAFAAGVLFAYLVTERRYKLYSLGLVVLPVALGMLWYATTIPSEIEPLVPALQNNLLLTLHVAVAILAYGFFSVSFGAAVLYLVRSWMGAGETSLSALDDAGHRSALLGFPAMALVIILGSIWAEQAWGRWWGWDPKETASLITFFVYAGYLHTRVVQGWAGAKSAVLLLVGFGAVLFTYFGNLFFSGLHAYSGVG